MRTTLTIDDDVAAQIESMRRAREATLKGLVNEALRRGLRSMAEPPPKREPFRTRAVDLGGLKIGSIDNVGEAIAVAEGERFR